MRLRWLVVIAVLLPLAWAVHWLLSVPRVAVEPVGVGPLEQRVVATGRVVSPERIGVGSVLVATVAEVLVEEGARVAAGAPMVRLVSSKLDAAVRSAEASLRLAEVRLRQLEQVQRPLAAETRIQAELQLRQAQRDYRRAAELAKERFVSQAEVEARKEAMDLAASRLRSAEQSLAALQPDGSEYLAAVANLEQARAALAQIHARQQETLIRAPVAATVLRRLVEPGDVVQPGTPVLLLASAGKTLIEAQLDERNLSLVELGQPALVAADAYPRQLFTASVSFIAPAVDAQRGTVEIELTVDDPPSFLRADMTVTIDILVARQERALTVPRRAVRDIGRQPWLLVARDGRAVRQAVRLGLLGDERVQLLDGVEAGELVLADPDAVVAGQRIRIDEVAR